MGAAMNAMDGAERKQLIDEIIELQSVGEITLGMAVCRLRLEITGYDQETFAQMCGMSTRALYQLETDKGNPTLSTVDSILRKFGLRMGIMAANGRQRTPSAVTGTPAKRRPVDKNTELPHGSPSSRSRGAKPKGLKTRRSAADKSGKAATSQGDPGNGRE